MDLDIPLDFAGFEVLGCDGQVGVDLASVKSRMDGERSVTDRLPMTMELLVRDMWEFVEVEAELHARLVIRACLVR